jgi:hypothetical protein
MPRAMRTAHRPKIAMPKTTILPLSKVTGLSGGVTGRSFSSLDDGRVLIAGGRGGSVTASAEIYDPATKKFSLTGDRITARYKHTAGLLPDGCVLIACGSDERDWRGALASAEIHDPRAGKFTATSPLNDSRFKLPYDAAQLASGELLIAGGSKNVELYEPATGKFLLASGQIDEARHFMTFAAFCRSSDFCHITPSAGT